MRRFKWVAVLCLLVPVARAAEEEPKQLYELKLTGTVIVAKHAWNDDGIPRVDQTYELTITQDPSEDPVPKLWKVQLLVNGKDAQVRFPHTDFHYHAFGVDIKNDVEDPRVDGKVDMAHIVFMNRPRTGSFWDNYDRRYLEVQLIDVNGKAVDESVHMRPQLLTTEEASKFTHAVLRATTGNSRRYQGVHGFLMTATVEEFVLIPFRTRR